MFERFTTQAREIVVGAQEEARELGHGYIGTEHLLLAMLVPQHGGGASVLLANAGLDHDRVRTGVTWLIGEPRLSDSDAEALRSIGIDLEAIRAKLEQAFGPGALDAELPPRPRGLFRRRMASRRSASRRSANCPPYTKAPPAAHIPFTPRAKKVLELSLREAVRLEHKTIGAEHILLGLIREGEGLAAKIMVDAGVDIGLLRRQTEESFKKAA